MNSSVETQIHTGFGLTLNRRLGALSMGGATFTGTTGEKMTKNKHEEKGREESNSESMEK